jgi:hypothetical protein
MLRVRLTVTALSLLFYACSGGASGGPLDSSGSGGGGGTSAGNAGAGGMSTAGAGGGGSGEGGASGAAGGTGVAGQAGGPDGGQQDGSPSDGIGSASFAAVQSIFATTCVRCHDPAHPVVPETQTYVALSLTMKDAYSSLVNKPATETCGGTLVKPDDPSRSYLYAKITQDTPCFGERMPHQGMIRTPPLPADKIAVIESWILGGAKP